MLNILRKQKGQSVTEIVVAMTLFAIVFTGGWQIIHNSYQQIIDNMNSLRAHYYIVEGLEVVRAMRNEDWNIVNIADESVPYHFELIDGLLVLNSGSEDLEGGFERSISISSVRRDSSFEISDDPADTIDPDTKKISVEVIWRFRGIERVDETSIYLTNWNKF